MLLDLLVFVISAATWVAILWLAIAPNFAKWSNLSIIALHALPPLAIGLTWIVMRRLIHRKKSEEKQLREQQAQTEREAARKAAREKHEEMMRQRHFGCDCRFIAMAGLAQSSELPLPDIAADNISIQSRPQEEARASVATSILNQLAPAIRDALAALYNACGAAAAFPIFVLPPSDVSGQEAVSLIRDAHQDLIEESGLQDKLASTPTQILFLPSSDSAANRIIAPFDSSPDLPGAVVLAFDSPMVRIRAHDPEDDANSALQMRERQAGKSSEAVIAMLVTHPDLPSMLKAIEGIDESATKHDSMTPYWDKTIPAKGHHAWLTHISRELRDELAQLQALGRIRRAVSRDAPAQPAGVLAMTRVMQDSLEQALINAGIIEVPFTHAESSSAKAVSEPADAQQTPPASAPCRWLVHNAGGVDYAGRRLAALGGAMHYFHIDLNPVDIGMSTNIATRIGDLGCATGLGQLAFSVAHAVDTGSSALCAEFTEQGEFAFSFVTSANAQA